MAAVAKLLSRMRGSRRTVRFDEVERVLRACGYELRNVHGSHHRYGPADGVGSNLTVVRPHGREAYCHERDVARVLDIAEEKGL